MTNRQLRLVELTHKFMAMGMSQERAFNAADLVTPPDPVVATSSAGLPGSRLLRRGWALLAEHWHGLLLGFVGAVLILIAFALIGTEPPR